METESNTQNPEETQNSGFQIPHHKNSNAENSGSDSKSLAGNYSEIDIFYQKLTKLHDLSGLNLLLDLRKASLDLHLFYKEVTQRGGFIQVTVDEKWGEVALALKLDGTNQHKPHPHPLMKLYALLLYQYEQLYFYRDPRNVAYAIGHAFYNVGDVSGVMDEKCMSQILGNIDEGPAEKKIPQTNREQTLIGQKRCRKLNSKIKETKKRRRGAPQGNHSAYHIFLKEECARLKSTHSGKLKGRKILEMAVTEWRYMSEDEKQPYIEKSNKLKVKRLATEAAAAAAADHEQNRGMLTAAAETETEKKPQSSGDYHMALQSDTEKSSVENHASIDFPEGLTEVD